MKQIRITYKELADMDPRSVEMATELVGTNPFTNWDDYQANKESIADPEIGQLEAIVLYKGKCIDGYHRTKICKELGKNVRAREITNELTEEQLLQIVLAYESRRNTTLTQKAVRAFRLSRDYPAITQKEASKSTGVREQLVRYVSTIDKYGASDTLNGGKDAILELLFQGRKVKILDNKGELKDTTSLEGIAKFLKKLDEGTIVVDNKYKLEWNPDSEIKTEAGKKWYYDAISQSDTLDKYNNNMVRNQLFMELANYKFKVEEH